LALVSGCSVGQQRRAGLAYEHVEGHKSSVWVSRADGSHAHELASEGYGPALSPSGRWLVYSLPGRSGPFGPVRLVDLLGGGSRVLGGVGTYVWSPDGRQLLLTGRNELVLLDDSGRKRVLVHSPSASPGSFSADGKAFVYGVDNGRVGRGYRSDLFVVRLSDGRVRQVTHDGHSDRPTWGGGWIAYRRFHFSGDRSIGEIRLMRADGTGDRLIARGHDNVARAEEGIEPVQLSADGTRLLACLTFEFGCPPSAFTIPGGRRVPLSFHADPRTLTAPDALSRDGKEILVTVDPGESNLTYRVYAVPLGGGRSKLLLHGAESPSWSR
jgi:hypothetical protein